MPLRTVVAKTLYLATIKQYLSTSQLFDSLCQPYKIVLSDKVSLLLNFSCHQLEKQVQNEQDTLQVINICFRDWLNIFSTLTFQRKIRAEAKYNEL